jgi:hypothetical protein
MAHQEDTSNLNREELAYQDYMKRGEDFMTIQIYRSAKEWYLKALELNLHNDTVQEKLNKCNSKIRSESHTIIMVLVVVALIVGAIFVVKTF